MTSAEAAHSLENKQRIANMINEGGIGVEAHYSYEQINNQTAQKIHEQENNTGQKDNQRLS